MKPQDLAKMHLEFRAKNTPQDLSENDVKELKGRFLRAPLIHDVPYPVTMEPNLVIEYYSR